MLKTIAICILSAACLLAMTAEARPPQRVHHIRKAVIVKGKQHKPQVQIILAPKRHDFTTRAPRASFIRRIVRSVKTNPF